MYFPQNLPGLKSKIKMGQEGTNICREKQHFVSVFLRRLSPCIWMMQLCLIAYGQFKPKVSNKTRWGLILENKRLPEIRQTAPMPWIICEN